MIGTMDNDTTTLISELLQKLAELQQKVNEYSQDMAQQYKLCENDILKNVPKDVSSKVERAITNSLHNYPALKYGLEHQHQHQLDESQQQEEADSYLSLTTTTSSSTFSSTSATHTHGIIPNNNFNRMARSGDRGSPPPAFPPASDFPDNVPGSPRERESELHGLFIPSYLPLLEGAERQSPAPPATPSFLPTVPENSDRDLNRSQTASPRSLTPIAVTRPDPVRRHTEETLSSITSDDSNSKGKRSALRRSSSSSTKTFSPRRVRFEVEGQEVLPTASPQPRPLDHPSSPLGNTADVLNESYQPNVSEDDDLGLLGSSPPRPKKITSTDRLKALARNSTEDTSTWTVVGNLNGSEDDEDDDLVITDRRMRGAVSQAEPAVMTHSPGPKTHPINGTRSPTHLRAPLRVVKENEGNADADEDELDDDILSMPALTSFKGKKRFSPPESTTSALVEMASQQRRSNKEGTSVTKTNTKSSDVHDLDDNDDGEPFFEFDDVSTEDSAGRGAASKASTKYIEEEDEPEDLKTEAETEETEETEETQETQGPKPPRMLIPRPPSPEVTSPQSRTQGTSVGSFRGKPIHMSSIRNEDVYEKAAAMGDFQSFIGSVDGRTGIDESTSYQPETTRFVGTPRSLSERLMMDEFEELRQKAGSASYTG